MARLLDGENYYGFIKKVRTHRKKKATCTKKKRTHRKKKTEPAGRKKLLVNLVALVIC